MRQIFYFNTLVAARCFCVSVFLLVAAPILAQKPLADKIYLANETSLENIDIVDLNKKTIKVRNQDGRELDFKAKEVLMAFNENGHYLTFPNSPQQLKNFLAQEEVAAGADLFITFNGQVVPVHISQENESEIIYHDIRSDQSGRKVSTTLIALIIYKEGNHKLFGSPSRVSGILEDLDENVSEARMVSFKEPEKPTTAPFSSENTEAMAVEEKHEAATESGVSATEKPKDFSEIDHEAYSQKALQKTSELGTYLAIISDRNNNMEEAGKAVELAVNLFIDENAQFEVSGKEGKNRYQVRAYLNRLKLLKYDKIEITWTDISYVSDLKKGVDGNYYGVITLQQRFKGYQDNRLVYGDLTEKNIEVKVMAYQKESDGEQQQMWDIFLSDVGVVVTKFDE